MEIVLILAALAAIAVLAGSQFHHARQLEDLAIAYEDLDRDYHELRNDIHGDLVTTALTRHPAAQALDDTVVADPDTPIDYRLTSPTEMESLNNLIGKTIKASSKGDTRGLA